jgi:ribonuclease P protein component
LPPVAHADARSFRPEPAGAAVVRRLLKRRDFLRAQKGRRANSGLFSIQAVENGLDEARLGFTVSKKVDVRSVRRNRIRRRLKEAARLEEAAFVGAAMDIVVVARPGALTAEFASLRAELARTIAKAVRPREAGDHRSAQTGRRD